MKTNDELLEKVSCCTIEEDADLDVKENFYYKYNDVIAVMNMVRSEVNGADTGERQSNIPDVSGSAWDLPDGVYQVGVDKATKGSKDYSTRIWMKKGISGEMIVVAEEHYR